jgi:hypothetical protein
VSIGHGNIVDLAYTHPATVAARRRGAMSDVFRKSFYYNALTDGTAFASQRASRRTRHGRTR